MTPVGGSHGNPYPTARFIVTIGGTIPVVGSSEASMTRHILVVEDQEDNRQIMRDLLTANDYEMTEAENGEEALAAVAKDRPDLILMDIQLPVMDGCETTRRIKADPSLSSIPIIAVTCVATGSARAATRIAGS